MSAENAHILVVDDDGRLRELLKKYLSDNGFGVTAAEDAKAARAKMASIAFDLIVLDLMMPGESGLEFAASIRQSSQAASKVPILMLTAMAETDDRIVGLEAGADDYLIKPFQPRELLLRINSILRRVPQEVDDMVPTEARLGEFVFNLEREELTHGDERVGLTSAEARLLKIMAEKPGAIFSREYLMKLVVPDGGERTVDVQVNRLRRKIEPDAKLPRYLQTVRGQGYILRPD
ncbi:MAG: response regulator [Rhodospirillales bacterium]|jgi:two-component system phosphate regulon response regulator OmpR